MNLQRLSLELPVEHWDPADYVPAAAQEAVDLAVRLRGPTNSLDQLLVTGSASAAEITSAEVTAVLRCRHDESAFEVQAAARVGLRDADGAEVAVIAVSTTSRWSSSRPLLVQEDTAETFTLAIGCLEPLSQAANALRSGCDALNLNASVSIAERLEFNRRAVFGIADLPDMRSSKASPLNPYALVGIAGTEASEWEDLGVPASLAAHWASRQLLPGNARWWIRWEFALDDALAWLDADIDAADARRFVTHGFPTPEHVKRFQDDTEIHPYDLAHLVGVVSRDEMEAWLDVVYERDLLEPIDVRPLVAAGLTPDDVVEAPEGLTAGQIIAFLDETSESAVEFDNDGWDELDLAERP